MERFKTLMSSNTDTFVLCVINYIQFSGFIWCEIKKKLKIKPLFK